MDSKHYTSSKTKLTLWINEEIKQFGKHWAKKHHESISEMFSVYLLRLKETERDFAVVTPAVNRMTGIIKGTKTSRENYKKHLEQKYLNA